MAKKKDAAETKQHVQIPVVMVKRMIHELRPNCKDLLLALMCFYNKSKGCCCVRDGILMDVSGLSKYPFVSARTELKRLKLIGYNLYKKGGGAFYTITMISKTAKKQLTEQQALEQAFAPTHENEDD